MMPGQYYVRMISDPGAPEYGPYSLKSAKDFARIGSKFGGPRAVTFGPKGRMVRLYERGYRRWPRGAEIAVAGLKDSELPRVPTPKVPVLLQKVWGEPEVYQAGMVQNPAWSSKDTARLVRLMGLHIWYMAVADAARTIAGPDEAGLVDEAVSPVPQYAETDARRFLWVLKHKVFGKRDWWVVANASGVDDLEEFAGQLVDVVRINDYETPVESMSGAMGRVDRVARRAMRAEV